MSNTKLIVNSIYNHGDSSPIEDFLEAQGGSDFYSASADQAAFRKWQVEEAQSDTETTTLKEAILDVLNTGGLTELTPMQQKVFQLCVVENLTQVCAATHLKVSQPVVHEHLSQACKTLRGMAEIRLRNTILENPVWTKEKIREVAKLLKKKPS